MRQLFSWAVILVGTVACQSPQGTYVTAAEYTQTGGAGAAPVAAAAASSSAQAAPSEDELVKRRRGFDERRRKLAREREDLDRSRADLADKRRKSDIEHDSSRAKTEVELADAERAARIADEDLAHFLDVVRARRMREDELNRTASQDSLTETREELTQLEMMYGDADLGDATAEIVMQRTRRRLARAEQRHALVEARSRDLAEVTLPREEQELRAKLVSAAMRLDNRRRAREAATLGRQIALRGLEHDQLDLDRKSEDIERGETELEQDVRSWESGLASRGS